MDMMTTMHIKERGITRDMRSSWNERHHVSDAAIDVLVLCCVVWNEARRKSEKNLKGEIKI